MTDIVETKHDGRVLRVCLNRPAQRNLLTMKLCKELARRLTTLKETAASGPYC